MLNGSGLICEAPPRNRSAAREFLNAQLRRRHRVTSAKTASKYRYTASRPLVERYLAQALLSSANSPSMLETGVIVAGIEIVFVSAEHGPNGARTFSRISRIVGFGGLATASPDTLGSIGF